MPNKWFDEDENITTGTASVRGIFAHRHIPIPIPLADNDLCKFTNPQCEIPAQTEAVYTYDLPIPKYYPRLHIKLRWELKDANRRNIICALIHAKIANRH
ncbi:hypothetical protein D915_009349 [Fasciola hepatica]|uniref:MD-2-related lipid-recognition domain-containing protein n=1 Tax=Fasciola hepatica TaxID=6192 RepID=A0A4E0QZP3_FASHE|nr:hypothetical protein D915_009349 [Fasciola hepatica]